MEKHHQLEIASPVMLLPFYFLDIQLQIIYLTFPPELFLKKGILSIIDTSLKRSILTLKED